MSTLVRPRTSATWRQADLKERGVAAAERSALGTTARVVVWPPHELPRALDAVDRQLVALDQQASRFREDSEISQLNSSESHTFFLSEGLAELLATAVAAAELTAGLVDPTVGDALIAMGYDRDFSSVRKNRPRRSGRGDAGPGMGLHRARRPTAQETGRHGPRSGSNCQGCGLGSLRTPRPAAQWMAAASSSVSEATWPWRARAPRVDGRSWWPRIPLGDERSSGHVVRFHRGGVATSSVLCRRWRRGDRALHHIIDPRTGEPAQGHWRTATVAAPTCAHANAAVDRTDRRG